MQKAKTTSSNRLHPLFIGVKCIFIIKKWVNSREDIKLNGGKTSFSISAGMRGIGATYKVEDNGRAMFYHPGDPTRRIIAADPVTADEIPW